MTIGGMGTTRRFSTGGRRTTQVGRSLFLNGKQATTREARMSQSVRKRRNLTPYLGRMAHTGARILVKTMGAVDRPNQRTLNFKPSSGHHKAKIKTRIVMQWDLKGRAPAGLERVPIRLGGWNLGLTEEPP